MYRWRKIGFGQTNAEARSLRADCRQITGGSAGCCHGFFPFGPHAETIRGMIRLVTISTLIAVTLTGQPAIAQSATTPLQAEAEAALVAGDAAAAIRLAREDAAQRPSAFAPAFILALGLFETEDFRAAALAAAQAYDKATVPADRRQAAQLAGNAWFGAGAYTRSAIWLRRAADYADTDDALRAIAQSYLRTRDANPFAFRAGAWVAPTDNINGGAEQATFQLEGLPFDFLLPADRQALSGVEYALELQTSYRLSQTANQQTSAGLYIFGQTYSLSPESRDLLPDAEGSDFSYVVADVSLTHEWLLAENWGPSQLGINTGRVWSGGTPTWTYLTLAAQQAIVVGEGDLLALRLAGTRQTPIGEGRAVTDIADLSATYSRQLDRGDRISGKLTGIYSDGGFENIFSELRGEIDYALAQPLGPLHLSGSIMLGYRSYDTFPTTLDGRRDRFGSIGIDAQLKGQSFWGFSPLLSLQAARTESNAEEFTFQSLHVQLGVRSNF